MMARRRAITEEQNHNEEFNKLSFEAEHLWYRMLSVADDYGIVPANSYWLSNRLNLKSPVRENPGKYVKEITSLGLGFCFEHDGNSFFAFKPHTFCRIQSQFIRKRTASEFLRLSKVGMETALSGKFREIREEISNSVILKSKAVKREDVKSEVVESEGDSDEMPF